MSGIRSLVRGTGVRGYAAVNSAPIYVASGTNKVKLIPAGSGTTEVTLVDSGDNVPVGVATGYAIARGSGTLVTGTLTVATGLATVTAFVATLKETGFATGAAQMLAIDSIATGAVVVKAWFNLNATGATAAATGTGSFSWVAIGTL